MRLIKHLFTTRAAGRRAFPAHSLKAIQTAIKEGERLHRAEIRLMIEPALDVFDLLSRVSPKQRARELFIQYRIWDTEENSGILLYLNLADRQLEIIADRGVSRLLTREQWHQVSHAMTSGFAGGRYEESTIRGIEQLHALLQQVLPARGENPNELPNRPLIL